MTVPAAYARRLLFAVLLTGGLLAASGSLSANAASSVIPAGARTQGVRYGIDVSHWQGRIAWHKVRNSGIRFAIAKATDGLRGVDGS